MAFNTGLSGLRASSVDLDVTGNNIANASTVGFKGSKAQFGDLYSSGFLSSGSTSVGNGVKVQDVKQSFGQGNISATGNGLDMAIDGDGFFVLNNGGEIRYSRAGQFNIDQEGFVTNNQNMRVQGYTADDDGNLSGVRDDLQIQTDNLQPRRTTNLRSDLNLDSREGVLEQQIVDMGDFGGTSFPGGYVSDTTSFPEGEFTISYNDGTPDASVTIPEGLSARDVAGRLNEQRGLSASATTTLSLAEIDDDYVEAAGFSLELEIAGEEVVIDTDGVESVDDLINAINTSPSASSLRASLDNNNELQIIDNRGNTVTYNYSNGGSTGSGGPQTQVGTVRPQADRTVAEVTTTGDALYADTWTDRSVETVNAFNPVDQRTYNYATSTTIYDSLGNSHDMTQFYVKEPSPGNGVGQSEWSVYLQIDGELVGGTDEQPHTATFDQDGELLNVNGDPNGEILVTDWTPKNPDGQPNGADGPPADPDGVVSPIPDPQPVRHLCWALAKPLSTVVLLV